MTKLKQTVTVTDSEIYYHILASARAFERVTLCGRQTIYRRHDANEYPPTCPGCLAVLQYCKDLEIEAQPIVTAHTSTVSAVSSGLAARALEQAIAQGKTIEIPSLGITITGPTRWPGEGVSKG